jgi:hypothetical protein
MMTWAGSKDKSATCVRLSSDPRKAGRLNQRHFSPRSMMSEAMSPPSRSFKIKEFSLGSLDRFFL